MKFDIFVFHLLLIAEGEEKKEFSIVSNTSLAGISRLSTSLNSLESDNLVAGKNGGTKSKTLSPTDICRKLG